MDLPSLLIYSIMVVPFSTFLILVGKRLIHIKSVSKHIAAYRKNPNKFDWFDRYFLGFTFWNAKPLEWFIKISGDKLLSIWWRMSGMIFIIFAISFLIGTIVLWGRYILGLVQ